MFARQLSRNLVIMENLRICVLCLILICAFPYSQQSLIPKHSAHLFKFVNIIQVDSVQHTSKSKINCTMQTNLHINSIWHSTEDQFLEVNFRKPSLNCAAGIQNLIHIHDKTFYIILKSGIPYKIMAIKQRDQTFLNLQRSVASMLHMQYGHSTDAYVDISGRCKIAYEAQSATIIKKVKSDCANWDLRLRYRSENIFSVKQTSEEYIIYNLTTDSALINAESIERHTFSLTSNADIGGEIKSNILFQHISIVNDALQQLKFSTFEEVVDNLRKLYTMYDIQADVDSTFSEITNVKLTQVISTYVEKLSTDSIGSNVAAIALAELIPIARQTKEAEFVEILNEYTSIHAQLVDLLAATQTKEAHYAINKVFSYYNFEHWEILEKYLQALAVGTLVEQDIILDLIEKLEQREPSINNEKLQDTILQTIVSLTKRSPFTSKQDISAKIVRHIFNEIDSCKNSDCKTKYIRALQNLNDISTISQLLQIALESEQTVCIAAMQALRSFPATYFNESYRKIFWNIFYQRKRKFVSTSRIYALDILMTFEPTAEELGNLLQYLGSNDAEFEIKTFVIQKLRKMTEISHTFKMLLLNVLAERSFVNNYHYFAQKGLTTIFSFKLSQIPSNESLLSIQEIKNGVLKRGSIDLILSAKQQEFSIFKLGIFTHGLDAFIGENAETHIDDDNEPNTTTMAGMEISVQNVLLRPLVFFNGHAELMGHIWSGTASESTAAYLASVLEQDYKHFAILSSGLSVHVVVIGARSIDLNGKVEVSIWNRNANVEIQLNSGTAIIGNIVTGWPNYSKVQYTFQVTSEPNLRLQTDVDFYSGVKLCMQLQRPRTFMRYSTTQIVSTMDSKQYTKTVNNRFDMVIQAQTLALNQKNNDMCKAIFFNE